MTAQPPRRVTVTSPRTRAARAAPVRVTRDIDEQTALGEVWMRALLRTQLRLAVTVTGVVMGLLGSLPLVFRLLPEVRSTGLLGLPVPWLVLGVLVYPLLVAAAWLFVRQAERNERDFADLVTRQ